MTPGKTVRIAAVSDVHYNRGAQGLHLQLFTEISQNADVLVLPGDLTDYGLVDEVRVLIQDLARAVTIPVVAILGNHDHESNEVDGLREHLTKAGIHYLDGDSVEIAGIGFAGTKGFGGGFGRGALGSWGEHSIKAFVQDAIDEALKLESALARLTAQQKVAVLHYSPIRETLVGEPQEIFPWLGSSRLEEPLARFEVAAVFHGHAHKGSPEGHTTSGIPVYNVAIPVLKQAYPDRPTYRIIELPVEREAADERRQGGRRASDAVSAQ